MMHDDDDDDDFSPFSDAFPNTLGIFNRSFAARHMLYAVKMEEEKEELAWIACGLFRS